ncbi:MAG: dihydrofolate reductase family protein [Anditalea sp.]
MERKTKINVEDGKQELVITREFDLPLELLFKAYVDPGIVEQWMGTKVLKLESKKHTGCLENFGSISSIDTIFYGRVSYDMWGNFQPDSNSGKAEKSIWSGVHSKKKYVFSNKPKQDSNATFINSDIAKNVLEIQRQDGKDIWLYGGAKLITTFINLGLIDIYRISVHPTALGNGKPS